MYCMCVHGYVLCTVQHSSQVISFTKIITVDKKNDLQCSNIHKRVMIYYTTRTDEHTTVIIKT